MLKSVVLALFILTGQAFCHPVAIWKTNNVLITNPEGAKITGKLTLYSNRLPFYIKVPLHAAGLLHTSLSFLHFVPFWWELPVGRLTFQENEKRSTVKNLNLNGLTQRIQFHAEQLSREVSSEKSKRHVELIDLKLKYSTHYSYSVDYLDIATEQGSTELVTIFEKETLQPNLAVVTFAISNPDTSEVIHRHIDILNSEIPYGKHLCAKILASVLGPRTMDLTYVVKKHTIFPHDPDFKKLKKLHRETFSGRYRADQIPDSPPSTFESGVGITI